MKKATIFLSILLLITSIFFFAFGKFDVNADNLGKTITTTDGASIRSASPSGLRFEGVVSEPFEGTEVSYGFILSKGEYSASEMEDNYDAGKATAINAGALNGENKFYVSIIDIPSTGYDQDITALAYVDVDGTKQFATSSTTRNIMEVAEEVNAAGKGTEFTNRICNTSVFNLNSGSFTYDYTFTITKSGDFGESVYGNGLYVMCASKANRSNVCSAASEQFYIKQITDSKYYRVVATGTAPADYDYVISIHNNCLDASSKTAIRGIISNFASMGDYYVSFTAPAAKECNVTVNVDRNKDKLAGNKIYYADGEALLTSVRRDYYTFGGWYDNAGLTGSAVTNHSGDAAVTYYAKWNPVEYTLSYNLQGGKCSGATSIDSETFTVESAEIVLPLAGTMSRTDYTFLGWYDNASGLGSPITSIPAGSHESITAYAVWEADLPVELALEEEDIDVFNAESVDIIVKNGLDGKYTPTGAGLSGTYAGKVYNTADGTAFTDLAAAADYLNEHDLTGKKIYVFAGSYTTASNLTKDNTLVLGPNYNIDGDDTRNTEAIVSGLVTITGAHVTINGLRFTGDGAIKVSANYATVDSVYMKDVNQIKCNGNNRKGCIVDGVNITNLTVKDSYINAKGETQTQETQFMSFTNVSTLTITNCYLTNEATTLSSSFRGMLIYNIGGVVNITNNIFAFATNGYVFGLGEASGSNTATEINIIDNVFRGRDGYNSATIQIVKGQKYLTTNIIHNQFYNFAPGTYNFNSDAGSRVNMLYNYHDDQKQYRTNTVGSAIMYSDYNCYAGGIAGTDASGASTQTHSCNSLEEVNTAYERIRTMYVDSSWSSHTLGDTINVSGTNYIYGTNAFATIASALGAASVGTTVNVLPGTYDNETLNITKSYIKLLGAYPTTSATDVVRLAANNEAIISNSVITITNELTGIEISGLKFTGTSQVLNTAGTAGENNSNTNINGFKFCYNIVECGLTSGNAFVYFVESSSSYSRDVVFAYNSFKHADGKSSTNMIRLDNTYNLNFHHNSMSSINGNGLFVDDTDKGASGTNVLINNNTFTNITGDAVHLDWMSHLPATSAANAIVEVNNNTFNNIGKFGVFLGKSNNTEYYSHVQVNNNTFTGTIAIPIYIARVVIVNKYYATGNTFNCTLSGTATAYSADFTNMYIVNGMQATTNRSLIATGNTYSAGDPTESNFSGSVTYNN